MPKSFQTVRQLLHWEYSKLIAESAGGGRKDFAFVQHSYKQLQSGSLNLSSILRENKLLVSNGTSCSYCGAREKLHWEHIIPRSCGGPDTIDNQVLACATCNLKKGARDPYQWYAPDRINEIPRLILGKFLKLLYEAYRAADLLDDRVYFKEQALERTNLSQIFKRKQNHA